eukprot:scaffold47809_cov34-Prasinocladus_malaysianus.AAC.1
MHIEQAHREARELKQAKEAQRAARKQQRLEDKLAKARAALIIAEEKVESLASGTAKSARAETARLRAEGRVHEATQALEKLSLNGPPAATTVYTCDHAITGKHTTQDDVITLDKCVCTSVKAAMSKARRP